MPPTSEERLRLIIEAEVTKALANVATFEKALTHMAGGVDKVNSKAAQTEHLGGAFGKLGASAAGALNPINALKGALPLLAFGSIATGVFKTAAAFESAREQFGILLQDAEAGDKVFENLLAFNAKTPFSQTALNSVATQLLNAKVSAQDLIPTISKLGDLSKGNEEKLATLGEVYGRISMKGKASMEELNRVIEAGVPITGALAQAMGVAENQVFDMVTKGQVGAKAFQVAVDKLTGAGGQYNGMMDKMAVTTEGKFSTAVGNAEILAGTLGEKLEVDTKAGLDGFSDVTESATSFVSAASPAISGLATLVGGALLVPLTAVSVTFQAIADGLYLIEGNSSKTSGAVRGVKDAVTGTNRAWDENLKVYQTLSKKQTRTKEEAEQLKIAYGNLKTLLPGVSNETLNFALATGKVVEAMKLQEMAAKITELRASLKTIAPDAEAALKSYLGKVELSRKTYLKAPIQLEIPANMAETVQGKARDLLKPLEGGAFSISLTDVAKIGDTNIEIEVLARNIDKLSKSKGESLSEEAKKILAVGAARKELRDITQQLAGDQKALQESLSASLRAGPLVLGGDTKPVDKWTEAYETYLKAGQAASNMRANGVIDEKKFLEMNTAASRSFVDVVGGLGSLNEGQLIVLRSLLGGLQSIPVAIGQNKDAVSNFDKAMDQYALSLEGARHTHEVLGTSATDLAEDENKATQEFVNLASKLPDLTQDQITVLQTLKAGIKTIPEDIEKVKSSLETGMGRFGDFGKAVGKALSSFAPEQVLRDTDDFIKKYGEGFESLFDSIGATASLTFETLSAEQTTAMEHEIALLERQKESYKRTSDTEISILEDKGESTVDARLRQAAEEERLQAEIDKKKSALARKQFEQEKQTKLGQIAMATALGIANTISAGPWAIPLTAGVLGLGGIQAGIVNSQQYPEAFDGAIIQGSPSGTILKAGEKNQTELVLPLREEKLRELGIGGGSGISIGQMNVYSNAYDPAEVARHVAIEFDKKVRVGR